MRRTTALFTTAVSLYASAAIADTLPTVPGTCVITSVTQVGQRLVDGTTNNPIAGSGSSINFADGGYQVSYDEIGAVNQSQVGDNVVLCLLRLPENCPPDDNRGKIYATTDLRTMMIWILPDSEHTCGGA